MGKMFMAASTYLPAQVSDMMNQDRAFATGRLTFSGQKNICTLSTYVGHHPPSTLLHSHVPKHTRTGKRILKKEKRRPGGRVSKIKTLQLRISCLVITHSWGSWTLAREFMGTLSRKQCPCLRNYVKRPRHRRG